MPIVTLYENVKPSDAANGSVGLASGMASRCTAGTAMYEAAAHSTANRAYVPRFERLAQSHAVGVGHARCRCVAKMFGAIRPKAMNGQSRGLQIAEPLAGGHAHLEQEQAQRALKQGDEQEVVVLGRPFRPAAG